ncbi:(2Fe-2S)-binding protein [Petroclostridium sp. X23]|uniref:(2Fe-2S)-binding protein n=1 Tax=Petroclostridium sp. X23 TaxID=3045146 RepID=UPI0024ADDB82|nr:(2Fe-2S)-binding protein [Petroclostridium sp. X23]WHH58131.1 (2Fe-2S)-binding protein [Petroclostridium sp. X23]
MHDDYIMCRCEEITLHEIENAIDNGTLSLDEIKKLTRAGMGLCQGRICSTLIMRLLEQKGYAPEHCPAPLSRLPVRPVKICEYIEEDLHE